MIVAIPALPVILGLYSRSISVPVPIGTILISLTEILILPLIAGQLTRIYIEKSVEA
ncbi:MAG: hypothetical protein ACPLSP_02600 [Fervidicoccus fontis]